MAAPESLTQQEVQIAACLRAFVSNVKSITGNENADVINMIRLFEGDDEVSENSEKAGRRESRSGGSADKAQSSMAKAAPTAKKMPRNEAKPEDADLHLLPDLAEDADPAGNPSQPMEVQSNDLADYDYSPPGSRSPSPPQNRR